MPSNNLDSPTQVITGLTNREFLERFAKPGCVGLSGGVSLVDKAICRAERHLDPRHRWGVWSHAFVFQGQRADGHHWVIESDLQIIRKHIQLGVQENRVGKYFDEILYTNLAVLDFGLTDEQVRTVLAEGLEMVASHTRYSLRELVGALIALKQPELRRDENVLARECSLFCSSFVQRLFRRAGLDLSPGVDDKNTTPEDISRTSVPHVTYLLQREAARSKLEELGKRVRRRVSARVRMFRRSVGKK
ncbi:MAG: hypothetical protein U1F83_15215 [Verrucomicrobiota bacterium]